jgi:hypothetical protein
VRVWAKEPVRKQSDMENSSSAMKEFEGNERRRKAAIARMVNCFRTCFLYPLNLLEFKKFVV